MYSLNVDLTLELQSKIGQARLKVKDYDLAGSLDLELWLGFLLVNMEWIWICVWYAMLTCWLMYWQLADGVWHGHGASWGGAVSAVLTICPTSDTHQSPASLAAGARVRQQIPIQWMILFFQNSSFSVYFAWWLGIIFKFIAECQSWQSRN